MIIENKKLTNFIKYKKADRRSSLHLFFSFESERHSDRG